MQLWDAVHWKPLGAPVPYNLVGPASLIAPGARFVATWDGRGIEVRDSPRCRGAGSSQAPRRTSRIPPGLVDPQARWFAIADDPGAVSIADPATGRLRRLLPVPRADGWLQFSAMAPGCRRQRRRKRLGVAARR
jgi:hypothetical protein